MTVPESRIAQVSAILSDLLSSLKKIAIANAATWPSETVLFATPLIKSLISSVLSSSPSRLRRIIS